jgi:hypothetical protein
MAATLEVNKMIKANKVRRQKKAARSIARGVGEGEEVCRG